MSHFRSKLRGQSCGHGALGLPACCLLHTSQPAPTFDLFTCFLRQHRACTGWSFPLLAMGLTSPIRLSNSWGRRPDFILICCPTHSSKPRPWQCWQRGEGSCRVDELWSHWIWWVSLCFGSFLYRFRRQPDLSLLPLAPIYPHLMRPENEPVPELARNPTCPGGHKTTPKASLDLCPRVKLLIKHVLCFSSQTHIPEINMSSPWPGSLPEGRQDCVYSWIWQLCLIFF